MPGWLSGESVGHMTWWLWVRYPVEANFFPVYFRLSPLLKHEKCSRWLCKEGCASADVRKPGNTCASPTACASPPTLAVKVALNPSTTNQPIVVIRDVQITLQTLNCRLFKYRLINSLPDNKILDWSKLKQISDITTQWHLLTPLGNKPFENTVGKGEIVRNEPFLLFPQCFLPV